MATTVLPARASETDLFYSHRPRKTSPVRSSLFLAGSTPPISSSPKVATHTPPVEHNERISDSPPISSVDSSPRPSSLDLSSSFNSTPVSSGSSLEDKLQQEEDDIEFPNYNAFSHNNEDFYSSHKPSEDEVPEISTTTDTTQSESPIPTPVVADDTAISQEPSRHVDYLSHDWREEDIWASWRHIVSQRKVYGQRSRLENASWRTWAKSKYRLRTVAPEKLNWLKESDVTWLYGPLKPAESHPITSSASEGSSQISKSSSFINKKPILKKRSVSEVMLQKSLSNSSLLKQAAASVQAQLGKPSPKIQRHGSDFDAPPSRPPSRDENDYFSSRNSILESETPSEGPEKKHIRFDEKVEQCIAVECKEDLPFDESEIDTEISRSGSALSDSSSDEGLVMMTRSRRSSSRKESKTSRSNSSSGQMIETLPSTTLKNRTDSPDVAAEAQQHHVFGKGWSAATLSPSPSQETLRPSRPSRNFLLANDDEDDAEEDNSSSWSFGASNPKSSLGASANTGPSKAGSSNEFSTTDGFDGVDGMRRTESGMFMPYDEDEDDMVAAGLFGRVSETFNTFRDISHVLWNVGWRK